MRRVMNALIRAPITAIVFVAGMLALMPVATVALAHENVPATDRAAPAQVGMEYSYVATVDQIEETAIGGPVARAGPIMTPASYTGYSKSTSNAMTIGHDLYAKSAHFSATHIARANGSPLTRGSVFATNGDPATTTSVRATARNGSQQMTSFS